jgi:uncharacterized protein (TIGR02453 family)
MVIMSKFSGFYPESLEFLRQVKSNNNRSWFDKNRSAYEKYLLTPFRQLVTELAPTILSIDTDIEVHPTINKTISRIFRDTRFSRDKTLFRDTMWLVFKQPGRDWSYSIPAFYFEITPGMYRYGMGYYTAAPKIMSAFREKIDVNPDAFARIVSFMQRDKRYNLEGETYKRVIPCDYPHHINCWYQMKTFYLACNRKPDRQLYSPGLLNELAKGFLLTADLYRFLIEISID